MTMPGGKDVCNKFDRRPWNANDSSKPQNTKVGACWKAEQDAQEVILLESQNA